MNSTDVLSVKRAHSQLLETLFLNFEDRFEDFRKIQPLIDIFVNPFKCDVNQYELKIQSKLIILRSEMSFNDKKDITDFWRNLESSFYPQLKEISLKLLSFFSSTIFCEHIFSDMKFICSMQRSRLTPRNLSNAILIRNCHKSIELM
uniref:General transcription factor II-I repeat domain-containing protein 2 n=1 Tax=Bactrocera latifrons TaxID=174628 RepID=A0A0K8W1F6_BACLA